MIDVFRAPSQEGAVNVLLKNFRHIAMLSYNAVRCPVRFRTRLVKDERIFFAKTPRQLKLWQERGGLFIVWDVRYLPPHDAILWSEAPLRLEVLDQFSGRSTRESVAAVFEPPTWRGHEEAVTLRYEKHGPEVLRQARARFGRLRQIIESAPILNQANLNRWAARRGRSLLSSALESREGAARVPGTTG